MSSTRQQSTVSVRDARLEDRPVLDAMMRGLNEYEYQIVPDRDLSEAACRDHMDYLLGEVEKNDGFVLIGELNGATAGFLVGYCDVYEGTFVLPDERPFGYIPELFVTQEARGVGLGKALIQAAERKFADRGLKIIRLFALDGNVSALEFYRKIGFAPDSIELKKMIAVE